MVVHRSPKPLMGVRFSLPLLLTVDISHAYTHDFFFSIIKKQELNLAYVMALRAELQLLLQIQLINLLE